MHPHAQRLVLHARCCACACDGKSNLTALRSLSAHTCITTLRAITRCCATGAQTAPPSCIASGTPPLLLAPQPCCKCSSAPLLNRTEPSSGLLFRSLACCFKQHSYATPAPHPPPALVGRSLETLLSTATCLMPCCAARRTCRWRCSEWPPLRRSGLAPPKHACTGRPRHGPRT